MNRAIAVGAGVYGGKIVGVPTMHVKRLVRLIRSGTSTKSPGASASFDLLLQPNPDTHPEIRANTEPLKAWSRKVLMADAEERRIMTAAWRAAIIQTGKSSRPWRTVRGPASATIATMRRMN